MLRYTTRGFRARATPLALVVLAAATVGVTPSSASAQPILRYQTNLRGDFALIGNTLGHDCGPGVIAPLVGVVGACGSNTDDSAPDVFWRADSPEAGEAEANTGIAIADARSTAMLALPTAATVTYARLYWSAHLPGGEADTTATLGRPESFSVDLVADSSLVNGAYYQSTADVTSVVQEHGAGAFRVGGVDAIDFVDLNQNVSWAAWWLVVLYEDVTEPTRNLALFDGLDRVDGSTTQNAILSGFVVPDAGFDAKLGVIAYEGDDQASGDTFRFLGFDGGPPPTLGLADRLDNGVSNIDNFFSSSRTHLGSPVTVVGDLPQLTGGPRSMSSFDMHVVDVTSRIQAGQENAAISANSSGDVYYLGGFITSISTYLPNFTGSEKSVAVLGGGSLVAGSVLEYTIDVVNSGNDTAIDVVLSDVLPTGVTFVPGSLEVLTGDNAGVKTDAAGDDQAEYDADSRTVVFRLGASANATVGGSIEIGASSSVRFQVTVDAGVTGEISNQASISAAGLSGAPEDSWPTDGNGTAAGSPPTSIIVNECTEDQDCGAPTAVCDFSQSPHVCVGCIEDADCDDGNSCTTGACDAGTCSHTPLEEGSACPGGFCSGASAICMGDGADGGPPRDGRYVGGGLCAASSGAPARSPLALVLLGLIGLLLWHRRR